MVLVPDATVALAITPLNSDDGRQFKCVVETIDEDYDETIPVNLTVTPVEILIKTQPKDATVKKGGKAKFTVKASGPCIQYQWYAWGPADYMPTAIDGATSSSLTVIATEENDGCLYFCVVYNADYPVNSDFAVLTLK